MHPSLGIEVHSSGLCRSARKKLRRIGLWMKLCRMTERKQVAPRLWIPLGTRVETECLGILDRLWIWSARRVDDALLDDEEEDEDDGRACVLFASSDRDDRAFSLWLMRSKRGSDTPDWHLAQ